MKNIVWASVINKPPKGSTIKPIICLPLLKGLLTEVRVELAVETYLQRAGFHEDETAPENYFRDLDVKSEVGFNDFSKEEEPESIQDLID